MAVSVSVLFGWAFSIPLLTGISVRFVTMKPATAISFFFCSASLSLLVYDSCRHPVRRHLAQLLALFPIFIGFGTITEFIAGTDLHFEALLFRRALLATGIHDPGRVSIASATAFLLLGAALLALDFETSHVRRPAQFLAFAVCLLGLLHLLGYFFAVDDLYRAFRNNSMALHTATLFLVLGLSVLCARPDRGFAGVFNGPDFAGSMARRVLPCAVILTVLLAWARLTGERLGFYGSSVGVAVFACANIAMFCFLVGWAAYSLHASTEKLDNAARSLALINERANQANAALAAIVASSDDAIISKTLDGVILSWNAGAQRIFGYSAGEAIGQPLHMLIPPDRASEETDILARISRGESIEHFETLRRCKNGSEIRVSVTISPLRDAKGIIVGASKIARDISETRRFAIAIEQQEARLSAIIDAAMDAIVTIDAQQRITMFNPAAEAMFCCRASEALGSSIDRFVPQRFHHEHSSHIRAFGQTHITRRRMGRMGSIHGVRSNGEEFPIEASISQAEVAGQKLFTVILRDITERKQADEEMRQQASLLDLAPVLVRDLNNRIVLWTRGAQALYGHTREQAMGCISHDLMRTQFPAPMEEIDRILHRDGFWEGELSHQTSDGRRVQVVSHWVLHYDAVGKPVRILEFNVDLTDLKRIQNSQIRSQKLESLGTLAGGVAHDFNNILLAINGHAKLAAMDLPANHPIQNNLAEISKAGARAADLVRRILAFSRPAERERQLQSVQPVVEEALKLVRATLPATIRIDTSFASDLPLVSLDATQMHQVVVNLATNASHAIGSAPGTININLAARIITGGGSAVSS